MENQIIFKALENFEDSAVIYAQFEKTDVLDGIVVLHFPYKPPLRMVVEIKKELRKHQIHQLIQRKEEHGNFLLIAGSLIPSVRKELQEKEISYIEENGNIFILNDGTFILIDTRKPIKNKKDTTKKAFTKTGLKLVFSFLINPELINDNQRNISEKSGVSLGTVPKVIKTLKEAGFLITHKINYIWQNRKELLTRWINDYETILKPKLFRARYDLRKDWREIELNQGETQWGGEPAGDVLTGYLRPEEYILYSNESPINLMQNYNLKPNSEGELLVYEKFWSGDSGPIAPHLLVYTDLILKEDKRCRETAQKIFDEYIEPFL